MPTQEPATERRVDSDGVIRVEQRRAGGATWVLGLGIAITCVFLALSAWWVFDKPEAESLSELTVREPARVESPAPAPAPAPARPGVRRAKPAAAPALPQHIQEQVAAVPEEFLEQLQEEGLYELPKPGEAPTGMMLFPALGTDPLKKGIIVPEDFELPLGYVRHYQTTDDGEQLPAILMFSPDKPPLDANGEPMKVPENGIVPPELAPPGLPIQILDPERPGEVEKEP
jgi:hypothetical protein